MSLRKILLALLLILAICLCYTTVVNGLSLGNFTVSSYSEVEAKNQELEQKISELTRRTTTDFDNKKTALKKAEKDYQDTREEYEAIAPTLEALMNQQRFIDIGVKPYDIEYLLVAIGEYATRNGVAITFNVVRGITDTISAVVSADDTSEYYIIANIDFTVTGEYNSIIEFMYAIEDDDELAFELNDFKMIPVTDNVQATFRTKNIPISTKGLSNLGNDLYSLSDSGITVEVGNPLNLDTNSVNKNLISDDVKSSTNTSSNTTP